MNGRRVWITGASSGLGAALAREYAAAGWDVAVTARRQETLETLVGSLGGDPARQVFAADVTDSAALAAVIDAVCADNGAPELTILNAGTYRPMALDELDLQAVRELFELNFFAIVDTLEQLVPRLTAKRCGHIAVVGSVAGDFGLPYSGPYSAGKSALMRLCQALRPEFEQAGLSLSIINPGFIATPLTAKNEFPMPFIVTPERAAAITRRQLERGRFEIRYPWQMSLMMRVLAALPAGLSGALARRMLKN